jgi:transposase
VPRSATRLRFHRTAKPHVNAEYVQQSRVDPTPRRDRVFSKILYKGRARIEQSVGNPKRFKRIALRGEKTARNYNSFVALVLGFILINSVHTA